MKPYINVERRLKIELALSRIVIAILLAASVCLTVALYHSRVFVNQLLEQAAPK